MFRDFLTAVGFLTVLPVSRKSVGPERIASATLFFPLVGLLMGLFLALADFFLKDILPRQVIDIFIVVFLAAITGGLHIDGLADTIDGLIGGRGDRNRTLAIMKDSRLGAMGAAGVVLLLMMKFIALDNIPTAYRPSALLLAPAAARWSQVLVSFRSKPAREGGIAAFIPFIEPWHLFFATAMVVATVFFISNSLGIAAFVLIALVTLGLKVFFGRAIGGITGDVIGAVNELNETLVLLVFTVML
ncbi:MAG: adenosylcobinamide-GDP ribazoletransferase [Nitrospirota bacterium]